MWKDQQPAPQLLHSHHAPPPQPRLSKSAPCSPLKPLLPKRPPPPARSDSFHVIHKVPVGDTPYVKAKHVQLVDKDPNRAIALFWAAINAGDRVDSALKDMAIVMKQQNRPEEAIEAIKSLRYRCSDHAQESLDNVLLDLYKRCGRLDDQIALLKHKLHLIHQGLAFNGRRTKTARSQGKKFQVSIEQEATRLLGNLGWAYMQQTNYAAAEAVYRKALSIEPDNNKVCNLGICLMKQGKVREAKVMLTSVKPALNDSPWGSDSHLKSFERAQQMLKELEEEGGVENSEPEAKLGLYEEALLGNLSWRLWSNQNPLTDADFSGALFATAGFGPPAQRPPLPPPGPSASPQKGNAHTPQRSNSNSRVVRNLHGGRWAEEDEEQGFANENFSQEAIQMDLLRQKLETLAAVNGEHKRNASANPMGDGAIAARRLQRSKSADAQNSLYTAHNLLSTGSLTEVNGNGSLLNSSAPPFIAKSASRASADVGPPCVAEDAGRLLHQLPSMFDNARLQPQQNSTLTKPSLQTSARPSMLILPDKGAIGRRHCRKSLSFTGPSASVEDATVANDSNSESSPDAWLKLGFVQGDASSPLCTIATALRRRFNCIAVENNKQYDNNKLSLQDDCQRRFQMFLDTTRAETPQSAAA